LQFTFFGKNVEVTQAIRQYAAKKLSRLERFFETRSELTASVTFSVERGRYIVEVTIPLYDLLIRGEERSNDLFASLDLVADKLEKQITRYRERLIKRGRPASGYGREAAATAEPALAVAALPEDADAAAAVEIVKIKRYTTKPMTHEEAILQMNLLGHDFFVFTSADSGEVNVVYRRHDGNYGLLEPDR
jgi:putative sigma-54 modulation protein